MSTSTPSHTNNRREMKATRPPLTLENTLRARIQVLEEAIILLNGRRPKRKNKHMDEIAQLDYRLKQIHNNEVDSTVAQVTQLTIESYRHENNPALQDLPSIVISTPLPPVEKYPSFHSSPPKASENPLGESSQMRSTITTAKTSSQTSDASGILSSSLASSSAPKQSSKAINYETRRRSPAQREASFSPAPGLPRDAVVAPSADSGGVPEPSQLYLSHSILESQKSNEAQNILLVIDLNGTLLYRPNRKQPTNFIERPLTQLFLDYVLSKFKVMIWSSARPENVTRMCNLLFRKTPRKKLVAEWARDRLGLTKADYYKRVQVYKRLEMVWASEEIQRCHPRYSTGESWGQSNTILIDDSLEKARSEPYNLVEITEFTGQTEPPDILRHLAEYLEILLMQTNVSSYVRRNPFKVPVDIRRPIYSESGPTEFV